MTSFSPLPMLPLDDQRDIVADERGNQFTPGAIGLPDGRFLLTWSDDRHDGIQARIVGADGAVQGSPFEIEVPNRTEATDFHSVSVGPDGTIWIAALVLDTGAGIHRTVVANFDAADAAAGDFQPRWGVMDSATTNHHLFPAVEVLANGSAVVSWVEVPDGSDITDLGLALTGNQRAQILTGDLRTSSGVFAVNNLEYGVSIMSSDILTFEDGGFMVTWSGAVLGSTELFGVYGQRFSATGVKIGAPIDLSAGGSPSSTGGRMAQLSDGNIIVVWQSSSTEPNGMVDVMARIVSPQGQALTGPFVVHSGTAGMQHHPDVVALSGSRFVVTWTDESGTIADPGIGVVGRMFDFSAGRIDLFLGEVFPINTITFGDQQYPAIAASGDTLLVAWEDNFVTGASRTGEDIAFRVFDAAPLRQSATLSAEEAASVNFASMRSRSLTLDDGLTVSGSDGTYLSDGRVAMTGTTTSGALFVDIVAVGDPGGTRIHVDNPRGNTGWHNEIVATPTGGFVLFFNEGVVNDIGLVVYYANQQEYDRNGNPIGEPVRLRQVGYNTDSFAEMFDGGYTLYLRHFLGGNVGVETVFFATGPTPAPNPYVITGSQRSDLIEGLNGADLIRGLGGHDTINGMGGNDVILGGFGHDLLRGNSGADRLDGGDGNDTLSGGTGNDLLRGGAGNDILMMDAGNDTLNGGPGRDWISLAGAARGARIDLTVTGPQATNFGRDVIVNVENIQGGNGNDILLGNGLANVLRGGAGADRLFGRNGNDRLEGGLGADRLDGGGGNDTLSGGVGADTLLGRIGDDWLLMDAGNDRLDGGLGRDWISHAGGAQALRIDLAITGPQATGMGRDVILNIENIQGGNGNDILLGNGLGNVIRGGAGADRILGRAGADRLNGGAGNDTLDGGAGNDTLLGGTGFDRLTGGTGADVLNGGAGNDTLIGGLGFDRLAGGAGADMFVFRAPADSSNVASRADLIVDFQRGLDRIHLRSMDADVRTGGNDSFEFIGTASLSGAGQVSYRQINRPGRENDVTQILLDVNGDGRADSIIRLAGLHDLTANDFIL